MKPHTGKQILVRGVDACHCYAEMPQLGPYDSLRKLMKLRRFVVHAVLAALAALGLIAASPALADPVYPYPCEKERLPPRPRSICEDQTDGPVAPDRPVGRDGPEGPGGPGPSGPDGPR
jgi:hypothetical protein